ncbi:MAG: T9SS type A sorting domain-containing protein [Endomicrobia bacterium]|nr:T9SS type A sorting domain-containing protein [Endomicrobiia bacterium]
MLKNKTLGFIFLHIFFISNIFSQGGIITGYILFSDKPQTFPIATVSLYISTVTSAIRSYKTSAVDNSFIFQDLGDGVYSLQCTAAGYETGSLSNVVIDNGTVVSDLWIIMKKSMGEMVLDDTTAGVLTLLPDAAGWSSGSSAGYYGSGYKFATTAADTTKQAVWSLDIKVPGTYQIYSWWVSGTNRAPDAEYIIQHSAGETKVYMNQQTSGAKWNLLGSFEYTTPGIYTVTQTNKSASGGFVVMVDALKYVNISWKPTPPSTPTNVRTISSVGAIKLTWSKVPNVAMYCVYRSTYPGGATANATKGWMPIATNVVDTEYKDTTIKSGIRYFYVVTALDEECEESLPSTEVYDIYKPSPKMDIQLDANKIKPGDVINTTFVLRNIAKDNLTVRLYTISGKCVKTIVENYFVEKNKPVSFQVDTTGLSSGLYFLNFFTENNSEIRKILIKK